MDVVLLSSVKMDSPRKVNRVVSHNADVQREMSVKAQHLALNAHSRLARHHHSGAARIEVERGITDRWVILSDERGQKAAMSIEKGRKPSERDRGMEGLHILENAAKELTIL